MTNNELHPELSQACVVCGTALTGLAGVVLKALGVSRSPRNPNLCSRCNAHLEEGRIEEITVLFADLSGFTALTNTLGPEESHRVVDAFLKMASGVIIRQGGLIDKYIGDSVMAFFNVPIRRADHATRALHAAIEIQSRMDGLAKELGLPLQATAGIARGHARVGRVGSQEAKDYTAIGDVVNVAARIQTKAHPGEVMVTTEVYEEVSDTHPDMEPEWFTLKGFATPVAGYRFLAKSPSTLPHREAPATRRSYLGIGSVVLAALGAPCAAAAALSPLALFLGIGSAASAAGGVVTDGGHGIDAPYIRIPLMALAIIGALANLGTALYGRRLAGTRGESTHLTERERRVTRWTIVLSFVALLLVAAEAIAHHMHHS